MSFPLALRVAAQYKQTPATPAAPRRVESCRLCCYLSGRVVRRLTARAHTALQLNFCAFLAQHTLHARRCCAPHPPTAHAPAATTSTLCRWRACGP